MNFICEFHQEEQQKRKFVALRMQELNAAGEEPLEADIDTLNDQEL